MWRAALSLVPAPAEGGAVVGELEEADLAQPAGRGLAQPRARVHRRQPGILCKRRRGRQAGATQCESEAGRPGTSPVGCPPLCPWANSRTRICCSRTCERQAAGGHNGGHGAGEAGGQGRTGAAQHGAVDAPDHQMRGQPHAAEEEAGAGVPRVSGMLSAGAPGKQGSGSVEGRGLRA